MHSYDLIEYLSMVIERGGWDLHLSAGAPPMARIYGTLMPLTDECWTRMTRVELILAVLKESQRARLEHEWELDFAVQVESLGRFRGNACYVLGRIGEFSLYPGYDPGPDRPGPWPHGGPALDHARWLDLDHGHHGLRQNHHAVQHDADHRAHAADEHHLYRGPD